MDGNVATLLSCDEQRHNPIGEEPDAPMVFCKFDSLVGGVQQMMRRLIELSRILAILAAAIGGSMAQANSLPAGNGYVQCSTTAGLITDPVSCNGGTDSGLVTYAPFAGISGSAYGQGLLDTANVFGVLNYNFEVTGGTPGTVVPVDINTVLQAIPSSIGSVFSQIGVTAKPRRPSRYASSTA